MISLKYWPKPLDSNEHFLCFFVWNLYSIDLLLVRTDIKMITGPLKLFHIHRHRLPKQWVYFSLCIRSLNPNDTDVFFNACVPWKIDFYTRKGHFFFMTWILAWNQLNFEVCYLFLAQFWQILAISSLKLPKNFKFFKNWARNELCNSKESWNHLEIDFLAKKYDLF